LQFFEQRSREENRVPASTAKFGEDDAIGQVVVRIEERLESFPGYQRMVNGMNEDTLAVLYGCKTDPQTRQWSPLGLRVHEDGRILQVDCSPDLGLVFAQDNDDGESDGPVVPEDAVEEREAAGIEKRLGLSHAGGTAGSEDDACDHAVNSRQGETVRQALRHNSKGRDWYRWRFK